MIFPSLSRTPLLAEAVKGGFGGEEHEIHGHLQWYDRANNKFEGRRLTHDEHGRKVSSLGKGIAKYRHIISEPGVSPELTISVVKRGRKKEHFHSDGALKGDQSISSIMVNHNSGRRKELNKHGYTVMRTGMIDTHHNHRRKGWGSTIYDLAKRLLHKHLDVELRHDWENQREPGERWAARQEVARGRPPTLRHRKQQEEPWQRENMSRNFRRQHPELDGHHTKLTPLANSVLDQGGGFFGKRETRSFRNAAKRMGIHHSKLDNLSINNILRIHGGESE